VAAISGIESVLVERGAFGGFGASFERLAFTQAVTDELSDRPVDLVAMAGFGTVLAQPIHDRFGGRILNTHPRCSRPSPGGTQSKRPSLRG